jgi:hypothetical protein
MDNDIINNEWNIVIMPAYNAGLFIGDAIQSVVDQTYKLGLLISMMVQLMIPLIQY